MKPIESNARLNRRLFWLLAAAAAVVMLLFNCLTPFVADDFTFTFSYRTGEQLTGLWDVLQSQIDLNKDLIELTTEKISLSQYCYTLYYLSGIDPDNPPRITDGMIGNTAG